MAKLLLADENFPFPTVANLRNIGHDVITLQDLGKTEQALPDEDVLTLATDLERAVLTINRKDFIKLHRKGDNHSGIIVCTLDIDFELLANNINKAINDLTSLAGELVRVNRG